MFKTHHIYKTLKKLRYRDEVIFTGHLFPEELHRISGSALALVYVSLFEGFGIPLVEAFATHTPVITSTTSSMPEVAGDAALYVDPLSIEQISEAMHQMEDPQVREELIRLGAKRSEAFSWDKTAHKLWSEIERLFVSSS